jgi:hypothetical protein
MDKKELIQLLKDPEVLKELKNEASDELEDLLSEIEITDDDTIETVSKKYSAKLQKIVKHFNTKVTQAENNAVEKVTKSAREKEEQAIRDFEKDHPGMKNPEVVKTMQPLYDRGKSLEEAYALACTAEKVNPDSGEALKKGETPPKKEAKKEEKPTNTSLKTGITDKDETGESDDEEDKSKLSIDEVMAANSNEFIAKHGDPFAEKQET